MTAIIEMLGGVRASIFAALLLLAVGYGWFAHSTIERRDATIATLTANANIYKANEKVLTDSNTSKDAAVAALKKQLDTLTGKNQELDSAREGALTALATAQHQRDKALADAATARRNLYAHDEAARDWAARPISLGVSDQLRERWASARCGHEGSNDRGSGPPACAAGSETAGNPAATGPSGAGVFDGDQLLGAVDACLSTLGKAQDQIAAIATLQKSANASAQ